MTIGGTTKNDKITKIVFKLKKRRIVQEHKWHNGRICQRLKRPAQTKKILNNMWQ